MCAGDQADRVPWEHRWSGQTGLPSTPAIWTYQMGWNPRHTAHSGHTTLTGWAAMEILSTKGHQPGRVR